jgi:hypothetical protein
MLVEVSFGSGCSTSEELKADAMAVLPLMGLSEVVVREVVSAGTASVLTQR